MAKGVSNIVVDTTGTDVAGRRSVLLKSGADMSINTAVGGGGDPETTLSLPATLAANARVAVVKAGSGPFTRRKINLIEGEGVTITLTDQAGSEQVDVQIAAAGGASNHSALSSLAWNDSGHTGTANAIPVFGGGGAAAEVAIGAEGSALKVSSGAVAWVAAALGFWGDGSNEALNFDGSSTVLGMAPASGVYTLTREIYATDLTIGSGVRIAAGSYGIWANGTLTFTDATSIISGNGKDATSFPGGASQTTQAPYGFGGSGGGGGRTSTSGSGSSGSYAATSPCGAGGAGGLASGGNGGGAGGNASAAAANRGGSRALDWVIRRCKYLDNTAFVLNGGGAGGGGGGLTHSTGTGSGGGGGGGARGAVVWARLVVGAGIIEAAGGAGANGVSTGADLAGGGGGGGGGCAILITTTPAPPCTVRAPGGAPGNGSGGGVAGSAGSDGLVLTFVL